MSCHALRVLAGGSTLATFLCGMGAAILLEVFDFADLRQCLASTIMASPKLLSALVGENRIAHWRGAWGGPLLHASSIFVSTAIDGSCLSGGVIVCGEYLRLYCLLANCGLQGLTHTQCGTPRQPSTHRFGTGSRRRIFEFQSLLGVLNQG